MLSVSFSEQSLIKEAGVSFLHRTALVPTYWLAPFFGCRSMDMRRCCGDCNASGILHLTNNRKHKKVTFERIRNAMQVSILNLGGCFANSVAV